MSKRKAMPTIEDLKLYQDELKSRFGADANIAYANITRTQLSVARHYGGATVQGKHFIYNPEDDSLIREDVVQWIVKQKKAAQSK
ncbi:MAG: hypothetical protein NXI32_05080 [bacterium]|nr:hypothetical protein [bacterium]